MCLCRNWWTTMSCKWTVVVVILLSSSSAVRGHPIQANTEIDTDVYNSVSSDDLLDPREVWPRDYSDQAQLFSIRASSDGAAGNSTVTPTPDSESSQLDPWSMVWYIGSFGGLVTFFLVVSCSECCCTKPAGPGTQPQGASEPPRGEDGPPPPPYHLFAPPPYDSLFYGVTEKDKMGIFVVPVHQPNASPSPPP